MFDPKTEPAFNYIHTSNPTNRRNDNCRNMNLGARASKTAQNYEYYRNYDGGGVQFRAETKEDHESGVSSPPLWHGQNNYQYLSPNSRALAIARGQRELMEMVKNMPESSYELSLKDLVEQQPRVDPREEEKCLVEDKSLNLKVKVVKRQESGRDENKGKMGRSRSVDNGGLLLKLVLPIPWGSKSKKNKKKLGTNTSSRVSPKPDLAQALKKSWKGVDKEGRKKSFSGSSETESGVTSSNSGSTGSSSSSSSSRSNSGRKSNGCFPGCWSFLSKKNKRTAK